MRLIDADVLKQHIDKLPALPDGNFAGNHSALKALINMQPTIESSTNCSEIQNSSDCISRQAATTMPVMPKEHRHYQTNNLDDAYEQGWNDLQECIEKLPPVQSGKWIKKHWKAFRCSECNRISEYSTNFCPNCGADMRGEEHNADISKKVDD